MNNSINGATPIADLTVSQFVDLIGATDNDSNKIRLSALSGYGRGLSCIKKLFGVSHGTAQRYKDTFLKPAIKQNGRVIIVDIAKAIELFDAYNQ